ncbi:MAG: archaeosortase/exosortase family protein [Bacteroidales bacterium]|nr:archaeosortase/exosortase family protein [Bacteroidales bacterium]
MSTLTKFRQAYNFYLPLSNYVIALLVLLPVYPIIRQLFLSGDTAFVNTYAHLIKQGSSTVGEWLGLSQQVLLNIFLSHTQLDTRFMAFWQTILFLLGAIFFRISLDKRLIIALSGIVFFICFNIGRWLLLSFAEIHFENYSMHLWNGTLIALLNFGLLFFYLIWWKKNYSLKRLILSKLKVSAITLKRIIRNLLLLAILLIVVQWITYTESVPLVSWVSKAVLWCAQALLALMGYTTYLSGRYIYTHEAAIFFSDTCAGIELMIIYASFIAILNGRYKLLFITGGLLVIFLMNVLRIGLIMVYLIHHQGQYGLPFNIHDLYTYPVYAVTFILWAIWIHFFNKPQA